jgi:hypothetical protein
MAIDRTGRQTEDGDISREAVSPGNIKRTGKEMTKHGGGQYGKGRYSRKQIGRTKI